MGICGVCVGVGVFRCPWIWAGVHGCLQLSVDVCRCVQVCAGMCSCVLGCVDVHRYVWDEFSEYLLETWVLTSADFNTYPIRIFLPTTTTILSSNPPWLWDYISTSSSLWWNKLKKFGVEMENGKVEKENQKDLRDNSWYIFPLLTKSFLF